MSANAFRVRTAALCATVALVAAGLATASLSQPPRLNGIDYSEAALTASADARLVLRLNQSVTALGPEDISVTPEIPVTVTTDGATVSVRLGGRLDYGSSFDLAVRVVGQATGVAADLEATIRVPDLRVATLVRHDLGDRIIRNDLVGGAAPVEIETRQRVQEYAPLGDRVFTINDAGRGAVGFGVFSAGDRSENPGGAARLERSYEPLIPERAGALSQLRADPAGHFVGVVANGVEIAGRTTAGELLLMDARSGVAPPIAVTGDDGRPVSVADWRFVSGGLAVVVHTTADELWLAAPALGRRAVLLGAATEIAGVLAATGEVVVVRDGEAVAVDAAGLVAGGWPSQADADQADADQADADPPAAERSLGPASPGRVFLAGDVSVRRDGAGGRLLADRGFGETVFFAPADPRSRIGAVCAAPNGSVVAVEVMSSDAPGDGRPVRPGVRGATTVYVDARTGEVRRSAIGFAPDWC